MSAVGGNASGRCQLRLPGFPRDLRAHARITRGWVLLHAVVQPLEPFERRRSDRAELTDVPAALPPRETDHPADEIVRHVQRDRARVDEVAKVLELHECLDEGLLELGPERVDRVGRRVIGELEDLADRAREELGGLRGLHQGQRDLELDRHPSLPRS